METFTFKHKADTKARGERANALIGVVASGNLEVLAERVMNDKACEVVISTTAAGFKEVWADVVSDFAERRSLGGLKFSINDGGARPDTVALRLAQAARLMEEEPK